MKASKGSGPNGMHSAVRGIHSDAGMERSSSIDDVIPYDA